MYGFASPMHQSQAALVQALVHEERITSQRVAAAMAALDRRHFLNPDDPELFPNAYVVRLHITFCLCAVCPSSQMWCWCVLERAVLLRPGLVCGSDVQLGLACTMSCAPGTLSAGRSGPMLRCPLPGWLKTALQYAAASLLKSRGPLLSCVLPPP